ncbi:protein phosphatase 2C domain-containing protein [Streptomyces sp. NPDC051079]|uniref:protein phosphatase 2C domain-containing protein n=1 Tax=Streptomyces sp. NPDC051079 TaxID=3155043 RepID=UPI00344E3FD8
MTQQGDNWWDELYDASAADTGPVTTPDSLDDRFDSASRTTTLDTPPEEAPPDRPPAEASVGSPTAEPAAAPTLQVPAPRPRTGHVGSRPPTYEAEPTALPAARPGELDELVADTVLDGARYGAYTLRAASVRGDSARFRGEPRRDALLTARFGQDEAALVLVAVAAGRRASEHAHLAAADVCRWIADSVGRSHARLSEDIRTGRRGDLKSGLHRLTDRTYGRLRTRAAERGLDPEEYTAGLRCLLLSADPGCRTRVFFGIGTGGLFRLRDGAWQDIEPLLPEPSVGAPVVGYGSPPARTPDAPEATEEGDRFTMDLGITTAPGPLVEPPVPPPAEPFRFRASVARPGDTLLLASHGLADPLRGEPALARELAARWAGAAPPGLAAFLADTQLRVTGYADDRTGVAVWEA